VLYKDLFALFCVCEDDIHVHSAIRLTFGDPVDLCQFGGADKTGIVQ